MEGKLANPAPVGLAGFGMTTLLLNIHNAGIFPLDAMILGMGLFVGGIAQLIAGIMEFKKGNTFGMAAFTLYGSFWLSLVFIIFAKGIFPVSGTSMGFYLLIWGIFTMFMTIGAFKANKTLRFIFVTLTVLFFLLAISDFAGSAAIKHIAGWEGIVCGASALYLSVAETVNESYGKTILPIGA